MILALWLACGGAPEVADAPPCHDTLPAAAPSEGSLYDLDVPLETDAGARVGLDVDRGHPVLVAMFYSSCTQVCPLTIGKIQGVLPKIPDARVLLVSLDPSRDDPAALSRLKAEHGLDDRWTLARPSEDGVREIAAALGVKYRNAASGEFNHSAVVALLDARGVPLARIDGLNAPDSLLVDAAPR